MHTFHYRMWRLFAVEPSGRRAGSTFIRVSLCVSSRYDLSKSFLHDFHSLPQTHLSLCMCDVYVVLSFTHLHTSMHAQYYRAGRLCALGSPGRRVVRTSIRVYLVCLLLV